MKLTMNRSVVALSVALTASACSGAATPDTAAQAAPATTAAISTVASAPVHADHTDHADHADHADPGKQAAAATARPKMVVHKSPTCGCCSLWVEHVRAAGFEVEVRDREDLSAIKESLGVPYAKGSCHTAEVGGYFVEGHVPAADIQRLLAERPKARGLTAPGMPGGSPGMEMPDGGTQAYTVELVAGDGTTSAYARH